MELRIVKIIFVIRYHKDKALKKKDVEMKILNPNFIIWLISRYEYVSKLQVCESIPAG